MRYYYAAEDVPVLMLAMIDKSDRADLSQAEKNALRDRLSRFAPSYRDGVKSFAWRASETPNK